jgi:SAM-dependent methyltransferase
VGAGPAAGEVYDSETHGNPVFARYRRISQDALAAAFRPGDRVLDYGCGSGDEAVFLAGRGVRVVATDVLPEMVEATSRKSRELGLGSMVEAIALPEEGPGALVALGGGKAGPFDGTYSSFGVLNCVGDLGGFARGMHAAMRPGAPLLISVMNRACAWEIALYMAKLRPDKALRRLRPLRAQVAGHMFDVRYFTLEEAVAPFGGLFRLRGFKGHGLLPPPYSERVFRQLPRFLDLASSSDPWPLRRLGDHLFVSMERV